MDGFARHFLRSTLAASRIVDELLEANPGYFITQTGKEKIWSFAAHQDFEIMKTGAATNRLFINTETLMIEAMAVPASVDTMEDAK